MRDRLKPLLAATLGLVGWGCAACTHQVQTAARVPHRTAVAIAMTRQAQSAIDAGEGGSEAQVLRQRLAANSEDLDARVLLARLYTRRGLPELALEHMRLAATQFPDSAVIVLELGKQLRNAGEPEEALRALSAFLEKHPAGGGWEVPSLKGVLEDELGQLEAAEASHRAALAADPSRAALHNNLGYHLSLAGRGAEAAFELRRAVELDPRSAIARNNLATALTAQPAEALAVWERSEGPAAAHNNLAAAFLEQNRLPEARTELETALKFRPDFSPALANLRLLAERDGQPVSFPAPAQPVSWRQRVSSITGKVLGGRASKKPAPPPGPESRAGAAGGK